ncbi:MAG TPA: hypothetical protein DD643_01530 [Synechococcus sp. UBA8638]|nr:hypothetical protein [Synechococcus sp. UBA8638]
MTDITERDLTFRFLDGCQAVKYDARSDDWSFYRDQFEPVAGGSKAVDILCVEGDASWLIEIKDYRQCSPQRDLPRPSEIADVLAKKVRDTLAGLAAPAKVANDVDQQNLARRALKTSRWRVVLHLEQSTTAQKIERNFINVANLFHKKFKSKKRLLKATDAHPILCDQHTIQHHDIPWTVFNNTEP